MLRHLDQDCLALLERAVPPIDISAISAFQIALARLAKQAGHCLLWALLVDVQHAVIIIAILAGGL